MHVLSPVAVAFLALAPLVHAGPKAAKMAAWADEVRRVVAPGAIPALQHPASVPVAQASLLPGEPVVGVRLGGESRAYSLWLLNSHEVVNDVVGGKPVVVVWCPLANMVAVYSAKVGGETRSFEASGSLLKNTVVLVDRESGSLWNSVTGDAIAGPALGERLDDLAAGSRATWAAWAASHPQGTVATWQGAASPGTDSYADYHKSFLRTGIHPVRNKDRRLPVKSSVVGLFGSSRGRALPVKSFERSGTLVTSSGDRTILIHVGDDGGRVAAYDLEVEHEDEVITLEFDTLPVEAFDRGDLVTLVDRVTGTTWDLGSGTAVDGPLAGARLAPAPHRFMYWFAWADYFPRTRVLTPKRERAADL